MKSLCFGEEVVVKVRTSVGISAVDEEATEVFGTDRTVGKVGPGAGFETGRAEGVGRVKRGVDSRERRGRAFDVALAGESQVGRAETMGPSQPVGMVARGFSRTGLGAKLNLGCDS
jgi:hypothetical protein